jgi:hypothetical protein
MTNPDADPDSRRALARTARDTVRREAFTIARDTGTPLITRPVYRGAGVNTRDIDPLHGIRAARYLELASRAQARDYIRAARETGHTWRTIASALELEHTRDPDIADRPLDELAYSYAAGEPDPDWPWRARSFVWHCPACDQAISDAEPANHPLDDQRGHERDCARLAAEAAGWEAQWEAGQ